MIEFLKGLVVNPFDDEKGAESTWRSKRWQGLLLAGISMILQHNGWLPTEQEAVGFLGNVQAAMDQLGVLWGLVGTLDASASPRKF